MIDPSPKAYSGAKSYFAASVCAGLAGFKASQTGIEGLATVSAFSITAFGLAILSFALLRLIENLHQLAVKSAFQWRKQ